MSTNLTRITGMYAPFDTDQLVKDLIKAENVKVDKVKQNKIYVEWQQEAYRDIINSIRSFKDEFFSYTNMDKNFRSASAFTSYNSTVAIKGTSSDSYVSVSAGTGAQPGNHTINKIKLGTKSIWETKDSSNVAADMTGSDIVSTSKIDSIISGDTFDLVLDGVKKTITLSGGYSNTTELKTDLQTQIDNAFGTDKVSGSKKITVLEDGSKITFASAGHTLKITNTKDGDSTVDNLGFASGQQNTLDLGKTLKDANFAQGVNGEVKFTINGVEFTFNAAEDTVSDVINKVNSSDAGVTLSYSSLTDKFTLQSDSEGVANNISISGSFLKDTFGLQEKQEATDTKFTLDGVTTTRSSNTFTIDGLEYTLKADYDPTGAQGLDNIDINVNSNPDELVDKIKGFVNKYNDLIGKINTELTEKRYYDFKPLTETQKKELTEDEVKQWEKKAKSGVLKSDTTLQSFVRNMRSALYESVDGLSLYDIGITTSSDHKEKGKLVIDEKKLKEAIQNNPNQVANLFSKEDEGLANKLYDIIETNITTKTDSYGRKGLLLEKAGMEGDRSVNENILSSKIKGYEDTIADLLEDLEDKENYYYTMFAQMEKALSKMNSQASFFTGQMG